MIYKWVQDFVARYSFVTDTKFKNAKFYIYYKKDEKIKKKVLPYRATQKQLAECIESIKKDINYEKWRKEEDKRIREAVKEEEKKETAFAFSD